MNRIQTYIQEHNLDRKGIKIHTFDNSSHTAEQAAELLSCELSQIVKSLIIMVKTAEDNIPMLVLVPGPKKLRQRLIRKVLKEQQNLVALDSRLATQEEVLQLTGFQVGGVPPISLTMPTLMDSDIKNESIVYGGGGSANSIVEIPTNVIIELNNPIIADICSSL